MATDQERLTAAANWIRQNQAKRGTPEFETVAAAYKKLRAAPPPPAQGSAQPVGGPEQFTPTDNGGDPYQIGDIEKQRREMVARHTVGAAPMRDTQDQWAAGTQRTPFMAPKVTGNRTLDVMLEPVTGYRQRLGEAFDSSKAMFEHGGKAFLNGDPVGLVGAIPGAAGMIAAPVSAALEPIARPVNEYAAPVLERAFGTPPEVSTPVLTSLIPGLGIVKGPRIPKGVPGVNLNAKPTVRLTEAPSNRELRAQAGRAYKAADEAGVIYTPEGVERLRQGVLSDLEEVGFDSQLHPRVAAVLKRLDMAAEGNLTLKGAEIIRRVAQNAAKSPEKQERFIAWKVIDQISDFLANPEPSDVLMGDAEAGGRAMANARELWSRMSKSEAIDMALETAESRAKRTGSGANIDNTIRQNIDKILGQSKRPRGFTDEEIAVMKEIVNGTPTRNALRLLGKAAPTGVVSGGFGIGAAATIPGGWMIPIAGFLSKVAADNLTRARAKGLSETIRRGKPEKAQSTRTQPEASFRSGPPSTALTILGQRYGQRRP